MVRTRSLPDRPSRSPTRSCPGFSPSAGAFSCVIAVFAVSAKPTQQVQNAPHPVGRQTWREKGDGSPFSDLRIGRIRHHNFGKSADVEPVVDGERPGGDLLGCRGTDDGGAENEALGAGHYLDMPADLTLSLGALVVMIGPDRKSVV